MKSVGALPTEERVQKMSDIQWIWYYNNLVKDNEEEEALTKDKIDYLTFFINPELAKGVIKNENINNKNISIQKNDVYINDNFEAELKAALGDEQLTELPGAGGAGNENMSSDEFLNMAIAMQSFVDQQNLNIQNNNKENLDEEKNIDNDKNSQIDKDYIDDTELDILI